MSLVAQIKKIIKSHAMGLYFTEWYKKQVYEKYLKRYSDREFIERVYQKKNPGLTLDLEHPKTFTEKLQWLKLYYRDPAMTVCSDKAEVKRYLADRGLSQLAIPTIAEFERVEDMRIEKLPDSFMLKASHGCGWNLVCRNKNAVNWIWMRKVMAVWLSESLYIFGREWNYKDQTPRILIEPLLDDKPLIDYKFMCFNGIPRTVQVNRVIDGRDYVDFYDIDWKLLADARIAEYPSSGIPIEKPAQYEDMLAVSQQLAKPFPFVRVDMYLVKGAMYLGEMTFFTGAGFHPIMPLSYDRLFGDWLTLPQKNYG